MSDKGQKVAIIIGGSQGIGASLVTAYRRQGWSVVATARTMTPTEDRDVLTVDGDLADPATADRIVSGALGRFGRIDTLINNADVYISKPFTDYTAEDYAMARSCSAARQRPRTRNCWSCDTRSPCCAGAIHSRGWTGQTGRSSPR